MNNPPIFESAKLKIEHPLSNEVLGFNNSYAISYLNALVSEVL